MNTGPLALDRPSETPLPERRFGAALAALGSAQKKGAGVPAYTRWVNRRLGRIAAAAAYTVGLTPNGVTMLSAATSAAGLLILLLAAPSVLTALGAAALLAAGYALDSADGQVARLSRSGSRAGEWLDHVVDAIRTPTIHLTVLVAVVLHTDLGVGMQVLALLFTVTSVGQFMSQILAEQLAGRVHSFQGERGLAKSFLLLPTDTGVLCWGFVLWAYPPAFAVFYTALFVLTAVHSAVSMRRKYVHLTQLEGASS